MIFIQDINQIEKDGGTILKRLLIRLDDITPDMNWSNFERVRAILEKFHIRPIIGVVPDNRDKTLQIEQASEGFWPLMRTLQDAGWTIAQHGYQHRYVTRKSGLLGLNPFSEFAGLSYGEQLKKLSSGQEILHKQGIYAKMFMAPGHTYDRRTLKALQALGFTSVTDGYADKPYRYYNLCFLPCTLSEPRIPSGVDTLCLHINGMTQAQFDELERFLAKNDALIGSAEEFLKEPAQIEKRGAGTAFKEKKALCIRRIKRFSAENPIVCRFMERTNDADNAKKMRKRIIGLPGLCFRLLIRRNYR